MANNPYNIPAKSPALQNRPLVPGFEETRLNNPGEEDEVVEKGRDVKKTKRLVSFLAKLSSADLWEYAPGMSRPYDEGSEEARKDERSGIEEAWETHEEIAPGRGTSEEAEPPMLNQ